MAVKQMQKTLVATAAANLLPNSMPKTPAQLAAALPTFNPKTGANAKAKTAGRATRDAVALSVVQPNPMALAGTNTINTQKANESAEVAFGGALGNRILAQAVADGGTWKMYFKDIIDATPVARAEVVKVLKESKEASQKADKATGLFTDKRGNTSAMHNLTSTAYVRISEIMTFIKACDKGMRMPDLLRMWETERGVAITWERITHAAIVSSARAYLREYAKRTGQVVKNGGGNKAESAIVKAKKWILANVPPAEFETISKELHEMAKRVHNAKQVAAELAATRKAA